MIANYPPALQKPFLQIPMVPPLDLKKNIFSNPKGGAFGFAKTVFAVRGGNLQPYAKPNM